MIDTISVRSRPISVTFFEDRAEVVRQASCEVKAGISLVVLDGVTPLVDDTSVLASVVEQGARVLATRVMRHARNVGAAGETERARVEADLESVRRRRAAAERALERARSNRARCEALDSRWVRQLGRAPRGEAAALRWRSAYDQIQRSLQKALDDAAASRIELESARLDEHRAELRFEQAMKAEPRYEATVEVQVQSQEARTVTVDLRYRTPCALWRPEHLCRLGDEVDGQRELCIETSAMVWQCTGETWDGIFCRFSTARPAEGAAAPLLCDDVLSLRKKTHFERQVVVVEARDQTIDVAGLERGSRAVEEMPGVDDGGEPVVFAAQRPATIPSDGQPHRVSLAEARMPCRLDRIAVPEQSETAHLRVTATLRAPWPLLAGPTRLTTGRTLMGHGRVDFVARGEPFELGFGVDEGVRIRRRIEEKREQVVLTGTRKITRTVRLFVSNLGGRSRRVCVSERYPVSEIERVDIEVLGSKGAYRNEQDGFAHFDVELAPRSTKELELVYRIEAASNVVLPF